ncbi:MAG: ISLre2 family transposase [Anaerocolumna sp.]
MYKSIIHFIKNETCEMEKFIKSFVSGEKDMDELSNYLSNRANELVKSMITEIFEQMDEDIRESTVRISEGWTVEQNNEVKKLMLPIGEITYHRTRYTSKKTQKSICLLDELIGVEGHQRISLGAAAAILEEAIESSYRKGGLHASLTDQVSKQAVKNLVHSLPEEMPLLEGLKEKKKLKTLHIVADEDHVAAQFLVKKGDVRGDANGKVDNTLMPKLICVFEDIINESGEKSKSKRHRLIGKHYFCGIHKGSKNNEKLWQQVSDYIATVYDIDYLDRIYISGDGARWIKAGCEVLEKSKFVLDKFHMEKYINRAVVHLFDSASDVKSEIYEALYSKDRKSTREIFGRILAVTENENKYKEVEESLNYLMNNWEGITIRVDDAGAVWGCCAEGQISHMLSDRLSSRPMGWSELGADRISKLRAYKGNGGKVIDLLKWKKDHQEKEERIQKKDEMVKDLRQKSAARNYAEPLQATIPGLEQESMKWMRDIINSKWVI